MDMFTFWKIGLMSLEEADSGFSENFENVYQEFETGEMLKIARKERGLTQEDVVNAL